MKKVFIENNKQAKRIFDYTESFKFNKVVSSFMILLNENKNKNLTEDCKEEIIDLISIYMPNFRIKMWGGKEIRNIELRDED